jgi:WD40 repeat protein
VSIHILMLSLLYFEGSMDQTVIIWNPENGTQLCQFKGHKGPITSLDWEPLHLYVNTHVHNVDPLID